MWFRKKRLYADAAAATPLSARSRKELIRLLDFYGNAGALHKEAVEAKKELENARATIANCVGAHPDEIVFTASGTEGNNLAIAGVIRPLLQKHGHLHAITCAIEHQSVLEPLRALKREGLELTELPVDGAGFVDPKQVAEAIKENTVFVSIQLVNSEVGTIEPVRDIAKLLKKQNKKIYFHTDASQAPLWVDSKVENLGVDLMTLDGQKVLGPKGIGALYIKRGTPVEPILRGGVQEMNLRGGTPNVPLAGAFAVALNDASRGVSERAAAVAEVRDFCWQEIKSLIPDAILNGPANRGRVANNINVSVPGLDAEMAVIALDAEGIAASTRSACNIGDDEPSHVIKALGVPKNLSKSAIRITFLPDITRVDATHLAKTLAAVATRYKVL